MFKIISSSFTLCCEWAQTQARRLSVQYNTHVKAYLENIITADSAEQ